MKKFILITGITVCMCLMFTGCVSVGTSGFNANAVTGEGALETYNIETDGFSSVNAALHCNIEYRYADSYSLTLDIQPNLFEYIETDERRGEFIIKSTRNINTFGSSNTPVLTVYAPELEGLAIAGAGNLTTHDTIKGETFSLAVAGAGNGAAELDVDELFVAVSGTGSYELSGRADTAIISLSGAGDLDARDLQTKDADVSLSGLGSVKIACSDNLTAEISGMGSIDYIGSPSLDVRRSGMGAVTKVSD